MRLRIGWFRSLTLAAATVGAGTSSYVYAKPPELPAKPSVECRVTQSSAVNEHQAAGQPFGPMPGVSLPNFGILVGAAAQTNIFIPLSEFELLLPGMRS